MILTLPTFCVLAINCGPETCKLNIGDVIVQTLNLVVVFMVVSFLLPYLKEYVPVAGRRA